MERKYSIDSQQSSGTDAQIRKNQSKIQIKKRTLKKQMPLPFMVLSASQPQKQSQVSQTINGQANNNQYAANSQQNFQETSKSTTLFSNTSNAYMSFTEASDSDQSLLDIVTTGSGGGGNNGSKNNHKNNTSHQHTVQSARVGEKGNKIFDQLSDQEYNCNPLDIRPQFHYHPFAERTNPYEEFKFSISIFFETAYFFIFFDILGNALQLAGELFIKILCLPFALFGLLIEFVRTQIIKRAQTSPFIRSRQKNQFFSEDPLHKHYHGDLQIVLDLDLTLVYSTILKPGPQDKDYIKVENKQYGGDMYVYKRPYLEDFLKKIAQMGQVSVFTAAMKHYADPIIDEIDPHGIIKKRFYRENCKFDQQGNILKTMDQVTNNFKQLVIIDDGDLTYQLYKKNTIKVEEWTKDKKNDKVLLDCIDILEQLRFSTDVSKNLKSILDIQMSYK